MSDRTWNHIDARLYEENWTQEAIIIAACLIARCPNQYGIFDKPLGFLKMFFTKMYTVAQIESVLTELAGAGFLKLFREGDVIWIKSKWKRSGKPSALHWKGVENHLESYPEVKKDFLSYYKAHWKGIESPLKGDRNPIEGSGYPPLNPDSESDTESELKDTCPAKNAGRTKKVKKNKPREKTTPAGDWLKFYKYEFEQRKGHAPNLLKGDAINAHKQYNTCAKLHSDQIIRGVTKYYLDLKDEVWAGHKPHVLFKNFDRLLEGMQEHQKKREARTTQGGISPAQAAWEAQQVEDEKNASAEVPDWVKKSMEEYKLPEATDES